MRALPGIALVLAVSGCGLSAQQAGGRAATGAAEELEARARAAPDEAGPVAARVAQGATMGVLAELDRPAQRAELQQLVNDVSAAVVAAVLVELRRPEHVAQLQQVTQLASASALRGLLHDGSGPAPLATLADQTAQGVTLALSRELGADGSGPLARSLSATAAQVSASTVRGIRDEVGMFAACRGPWRERCVEQRISDLSRAAAAGIGDGLRDLIRIPLLVLAFVLGALIALAFAWLWSQRRPRAEHAPPPIPERTPAHAR